MGWGEGGIRATVAGVSEAEEGEGLKFRGCKVYAVFVAGNGLAASQAEDRKLGYPGVVGDWTGLRLPTVEITVA